MTFLVFFLLAPLQASEGIPDPKKANSVYKPTAGCIRVQISRISEHGDRFFLWEPSSPEPLSNVQLIVSLNDPSVSVQLCPAVCCWSYWWWPGAHPRGSRCALRARNGASGARCSSRTSWRTSRSCRKAWVQLFPLCFCRPWLRLCSHFPHDRKICVSASRPAACWWAARVTPSWRAHPPWPRWPLMIHLQVLQQ